MKIVMNGSNAVVNLVFMLQLLISLCSRLSAISISGRGGNPPSPNHPYPINNDSARSAACTYLPHCCSDPLHYCYRFHATTEASAPPKLLVLRIRLKFLP